MSSNTAPERTALPTRRRTLVLRLTALYALSASLVLLVAVLVVYRELVNDLDREDDVLLRENALLVDALLLRPPREPQQSLLALDRNRERLGARRILVRIVDGTGKVLVETPDMSNDLPADGFPPAVEPHQGSVRGTDVQRGGHRYRLLAAHLQSTVIGGAEATVQLALDRAADLVQQARYRNLLMAVAIPGLLLSALLGQWMARRAIAPITTAAARIAGIDAESLHARVPTVDLADELRPLVASFNDLLARLEQAFDRLRNFSAHLAHELRTPINVLRGEIEMALADPTADLPAVLRSVRDEAGSLSHIVEGLLFLAYAERPGATVATRPIDVGTLAQDVVDFYEPLAAEAGVTMTASGEPGLVCALDRAMVQRALGNLLSNALAFTPRGGRITVTTRRHERFACIDVEDTGCGIAADRLPAIFDGAWRQDDVRPAAGARTGLGIGLSIVKAILRLHHGTVAIRSRPGHGTCVTLQFECAASTDLALA